MLSRRGIRHENSTGELHTGDGKTGSIGETDPKHIHIKILYIPLVSRRPSDMYTNQGVATP